MNEPFIPNGHEWDAMHNAPATPPAEAFIPAITTADAETNELVFIALTNEAARVADEHYGAWKTAIADGNLDYDKSEAYRRYRDRIDQLHSLAQVLTEELRRFTA